MKNSTKNEILFLSAFALIIAHPVFALWRNYLISPMGIGMGAVCILATLLAIATPIGIVWDKRRSSRQS